MFDKIKNFVWTATHHDSVLGIATDSLNFIKRMLESEVHDMDFILQQTSQIREIVEGKDQLSDISDIPYLLDEIELVVEGQKADAKDLLTDEVEFTQKMLESIKFS